MLLLRHCQIKLFKTFKNKLTILIYLFIIHKQTEYRLFISVMERCLSVALYLCTCVCAKYLQLFLSLIIEISHIQRSRVNNTATPPNPRHVPSKDRDQSVYGFQCSRCCHMQPWVSFSIFLQSCISCTLVGRSGNLIGLVFFFFLVQIASFTGGGVISINGTQCFIYLFILYFACLYFNTFYLFLKFYFKHSFTC